MVISGPTVPISAARPLPMRRIAADWAKTGMTVESKAIASA